MVYFLFYRTFSSFILWSSQVVSLEIYKISLLDTLGNMGKVFEMEWEPNFSQVLPLRNFSQMMSLSSGGVEVINISKSFILYFINFIVRLIMILMR